ncbi:MAG: hypothetical protein ACTSR3_14295, partial [Candidatus Helarchaeota archaeon]
MPIDLEKTIKALERKKNKFKEYQQQMENEFKEFRDKFETEFKNLSKSDIENRIKNLDADKVNPEFPGAFPTDELDDFPDYIVNFPHKFKTHEEARIWANQILVDTYVGSSDGSQIYRSREYSIPVSMINIGYFLNPHNPNKKYIKELEVEVLTPSELTLSIPTKPGKRPIQIFYEQKTNLYR